VREESKEDIIQDQEEENEEVDRKETVKMIGQKRKA